MLRLRNLFFILIFSLNLQALEVVSVTSKIDYHEIIHLSKLKVIDVQSVRKYCEPVSFKEFKTKKLVAKRYLKEGTILCTKDIEEYSKNSVIFNFGSIEVEKPGEVIYENDEYIKIKKIDGKIEKIYKDGRLQ